MVFVVRRVFQLAARGIDVAVDKEELIKALQYDRGQYEEGFRMGYSAGYDRKASEVAREIFEEIEDVLNNIGYFDELDFEALKKKYPDSICSLNAENPLQLIIATRLSAQCTDARVNLVTPALFEKYRN